MKVVFASHNEGKIGELQSLLHGLDLVVIPQKDLGVEEIEETGLTFIENALLKARHACQVTGLPAIADDSGLEVFALKNAPGIYSARFAGKQATAKENIQKLLVDLQNIAPDQRQARFYCCLVYLAHANDPTPLICDGTWPGLILPRPQGENGFGYDPVFFDPHEGCSAAELPASKKNFLSHRGKALKCLLKKLPEKL